MAQKEKREKKTSYGIEAVRQQVKKRRKKKTCDMLDSFSFFVKLDKNGKELKKPSFPN